MAHSLCAQASVSSMCSAQCSAASKRNLLKQKPAKIELPASYQRQAKNKAVVSLFNLFGNQEKKETKEVAVAASSGAPPAVTKESPKEAAAPLKPAVERTYVMIKPDGVQRGLVGEIIARFEKKGFVLRGLKLFQTPQELAQEHYSSLSDKPFYPALVGYIVSGPVVAMVWEGKGVVASARKLIGATNPLTAEPGTIRGDLAVEVGRNVIHGSDSIDNGEREISLWFNESELCAWEPSIMGWLRE